MGFFYTGQTILLGAISLAASLASLLALVHACVQRPDAFVAVDRQTKKIWVAILTASTLVLVFFGILASGLLGLLSLAAIVAVLVYYVDVRKRLDHVQNKSWFRKLS